MDDKEIGVKSAIAELDTDSNASMQTLAAQFMQKRLENSKSIEDIRRVAINQLSTKVNDESKPGFLLSVIETLGDQSANDLNALMKAQSGGNGRGQGASVSLFFGMPNEAGAVPVGPSLPKEAYQQLDRLLIAADAVINVGWQPPRVAEIVDAAVVEPATVVQRPTPIKYVPKKVVAKKPAPAKKAVAKKIGIKKPIAKASKK